MATISELDLKNVGPLENRNELRRAYTKIDQKIQQLIQTQGFPKNDEESATLIERAFQSAVLLPINGLAIALHALNSAIMIPDESVKREKIKEAIRTIQRWKQIMDSQIKAGYKMPATVAFYAQCEQRISQIDPDQKIRWEIKNEDNLWPIAIDLGNELIVPIATPALLTPYLGPSFRLTTLAFGLYNSIRAQ